MPSRPPTPRKHSRYQQADWSRPEEWAKFIAELADQPPGVFEPGRPDPRWEPTKGGQPPYLPGEEPERWPLPRPEPSAPSYGTLAEWMEAGGAAVPYYGVPSDLDWDDS